MGDDQEEQFQNKSQNRRQQVIGSARRQLLTAETPADIPPGAVLLTQHEVGDLFNRTIDNWEPKRDMWSVRYGSLLLGGVASIGGAICVTHFRARMLLQQNARIVSMIPTVFLPGVITTLAQHSDVMRRLVNPDRLSPVCPVCAEIRAISIQVTTGVGLPFALSIMACSALAKLTSSFPLPPLNEPVALFRTYLTLTRPLRSTIYIMIAANIINSAVLVYSQGKAVAHVHAKITENNVFI